MKKSEGINEKKKILYFILILKDGQGTVVI
jgi:hypothetical protein